jgi:acyl-CoA thioesterase I
MRPQSRPTSAAEGAAVAPLCSTGSQRSRSSRLVSNLEAGTSQTVVAYGTSLTGGGAWVEQLSAQLDRAYPGLATVVNSGEGGMWSRWGVDNLDARVIARQPDTVFIEFSINDAYLPYDTSVEQARSNLDSMIDRILAANSWCEIILLVMNPPTGIHRDCRPNIESYNHVYRDVAAQRRLTLIDHYPDWQRLLVADPNRFLEYVPDGLHPNAAGCAMVVTPAIVCALGMATGPTLAASAAPATDVAG